MRCSVIQKNEHCTTFEAKAKNGKITVNIDKGKKGKVLYPATTSFGIASMNECGCLEDVGHVLVTDSSQDFKDADISDQLIGLANGIAEVVGELAVLLDTETVEWACEVCEPTCLGCSLPFGQCECEDPDSDTYHCGCCKCCGCSCD